MASTMNRYLHHLLLAAIGLSILAILGCGEDQPSKLMRDNNTKPSASGFQKRSTDPLPKYSIIDQKSYDAPIKTQIELHVQVDKKITESNIEQLLNKLYVEASMDRSFKYNGGKATHIFIYIYTSREHFESGMGQWIGMLSKVGAGTQADISIKKDLLAKLQEAPKVVNGLTEHKRRQIFNEIVTVEDRARTEAENTYPIPNPSRIGYSQTKAREQIIKQTQAMDKLLSKYKKELAQKHNISVDQLQDILGEGVNSNWPIPK